MNQRRAAMAGRPKERGRAATQVVTRVNWTRRILRSTTALELVATRHGEEVCTFTKESLTMLQLERCATVTLEPLETPVTLIPPSNVEQPVTTSCEPGVTVNVAIGPKTKDPVSRGKLNANRWR